MEWKIKQYDIFTLSNAVQPWKDFTTSENRTRSLPETSRTPVDAAAFVSVVATCGNTTDQIGNDSEGTKAASDVVRSKK